MVILSFLRGLVSDQGQGAISLKGVTSSGYACNRLRERLIKSGWLLDVPLSRELHLKKVHFTE